MSSRQDKKRDREITREIHRLFWKANFQFKWGVPVCLITRIPAFAMIHLFMPLIIAYALQAIIDHRFDAVSGYAWQIMFIAAIYAVTWAIGGFFISYCGVKAGSYLQRRVFANYLDKDYDFYSNTYFGSLGAQATRLREALNGDYNMTLILAVPKQLVIIIGGVLMIATQSLVLAGITLVSMALVMSFTLLSGTWRLRYRRKVSEESSEIAGKIGDALTQATVVKSFATEQYEERRLQGTLKKWEHAQYFSWILSIPADIGRYALAAAATAVLLVMTARMYQDGTISIAIVALVQLYVVKMIASTTDISEIIKSYESAMGSAYQPVKTMLVDRAIKDKSNAKTLVVKKQQALTFENVSFHYPDAPKGLQAIKNFNLTIQPGEKIGVVGYSGSGKTTLTKLILRFMDITDGSMRIGDKDIRDVTQQSLRNNISYVPQEPLLFHRSVSENIAYGRPEASKKAIQEAARMAYVDEFAEELPQGYSTLVGERGVKLSGGQRQRVAIARAILKDAPILVLDEATSALDSRSELLIQKALWQLMKDRTALVIAHRLSTIQRMDRIVVMDKGKIVQVGTHEELLKDKKGIYAELWSHQSGGYIGVPSNNDEENDVFATSVAQSASAVY